MTTHSPDSAALRQRRYKAHKGGDHSLCRPEHCDQVDPGPRTFHLPERGVVTAVLDFIDRLPVASERGPQMVLSRAAVALADAIDARQSGLAGNIRELRSVMSQLGEADHEDPVDEVRAQRAKRRAALLSRYTGENDDEAGEGF